MEGRRNGWCDEGQRKKTKSVVPMDQTNSSDVDDVVGDGLRSESVVQPV